MKQTKVARSASVKQKAIVAAVASALASGGAMAFEFDTDSGWRGSLNTTVSGSAGWRIEGRDKALVSAADAVAAGFVAPVTPVAAAGRAGTAYASGAANAAAAAQGYRGGSNTDSADVNYDKGDRYSTVLKFVSDLELKKGDMGALVRVKGWYDQVKNDENSRYGHENTGYAGMIGSATATTATRRRPLSDDGFGRLNRFDGLYLLDAYGYTGFDLGENPGQVRIGRQALNWGESIFFQGINTISPLDTTALRAAGTEIKEALLPIWSISANLGLPGGMSMDAFYQLKWDHTVLDSCGSSIWATAEGGVGTANRYSQRCDMLTSFGGNNANVYNNTTALSGVYTLLRTPNPFDGGQALWTKNGGTGPVNTVGHGGNVGSSGKPGDSGQWGVSFRLPAESIDTEFGFYYTNLHGRIPTASLNNATTAGIDTARNMLSTPFLTLALVAGGTPAPTAMAVAAAVSPVAMSPGAAGSTGAIYTAALNNLSGGLVPAGHALDPAVASAAFLALGGNTVAAITGSLMAASVPQAVAAGMATTAFNSARQAGASTATVVTALSTAGFGTALAANPAAAAYIGAASVTGAVLGMKQGAPLVAGNTMNGYWAYQKNVQTIGMSAATNLWGVSWGAELSHQRDLPVQINGNDLIVGALAYGALRSAGLPVATIRGLAAAGASGMGPLATRIANAGDGGYVRGYDLFNKTQLQVSGVGSLPSMLGATAGLVIGEIAAQWNNVPDSKNGLKPRYGRAFIFGQGASPLWAGSALTNPYVNCAAGNAAAAAGAANVNPTGCKDDGYVTDFAWGYRVRASLDFPQIFGTSWSLTPSVFLGHDVDGYSMDYQMNKGRQTLALGLKFDLNKVHKLEFGYTTYSNRADYDPLRDRDNATVAYAYTF